MAAPAAPRVERKRWLGLDRTAATGYLAGLLVAACWGTSPIFIAKGLVGLPSPLWGVAVGLAAAALVYLAWLVVRRPEPRVRVLAWGALPSSGRAAIGWLVLSGLVLALGSVARTVALDVATVVLVLPLAQTATLWTIVLSPLLLGREVARITPRLVWGAVLIVGGVVLVVLGQAG
jgi:drug/metabolite transporter (DMT)-like permease